MASDESRLCRWLTALALALPLLSWAIMPIVGAGSYDDPVMLRRDAVTSRLMMHSLAVFGIIGFILSLAAYRAHRRSENYPSAWKRGLILVTALMAAAGLLARSSAAKAQETALISRCINRLRLIDAGKEQYALANKLQDGDVVTYDEIRDYIKDSYQGATNCSYGSAFVIGKLGEEPVCPTHGTMEVYGYPEQGHQWVNGQKRPWPKTSMLFPRRDHE